MDLEGLLHRVMVKRLEKRKIFFKGGDRR